MTPAPPEAVPAGWVVFLEETARYFERRPTGGEDAAHWANVANAETCRKIAAMLSAAPPAPSEVWRGIETAPKNRHFTAQIHHGSAGYRIVRAKWVGTGVHDTAEGSCVGWRPGSKFPAYWTDDPPFAPPAVPAEGE